MICYIIPSPFKQSGTKLYSTHIRVTQACANGMGISLAIILYVGSMIAQLSLFFFYFIAKAVLISILLI